MTPSQHPAPFRFPPTFFTNDCHELSQSVRAELIRFLKALQENPYSPDFVGAQEKCSDKHACEFCYGYVIYWMLKTSNNRVSRIDILKIAKVADLT